MMILDQPSLYKNMFISQQFSKGKYLLVAIIIAIISTRCYSCGTGYGTDAGGVCQLCVSMMAQCTSCSNNTYCSQCNTNYYLSSTNNSCQPCSLNMTNCLTCATSNNCTGCLTGYYLVSTTACALCDTAVPNCQYCTSNGTCSQCIVTYYVTNQTCASCGMNGCYNCSSASVCVSCNLGYYLSPSNTCATCTDTNCVNCTSSTICQQCTTDFMLNSGKTACVCQAGWAVTGVCTSVLGCTTAAKVNSVSTCLFCDSLNNFIISGTTCVCKTGYKLSNKQCWTLCGDGLIISPEVCDDSNTVNGDGCSSSCQLQPNYNCSYDTSSVYKCVLSSKFTVSLQYIEKAETDNACTYYFSISPSSPNFQKANLTNYIYLVLPSLNYTTNSVSYSNGVLSIAVSFTADIENLASTLYVNFDPTYFNTTNFTYGFVSVGTNNPLIVSNYSAYLKYFKIGCYVILVIAVLILILSIAFQKMIGIETINTLQLIFFTRLLYIQNDLIISSQIFNLKYIMGYNDISADMKQSNQIPLEYRRLLFNTDFILNFQTGLLLMLISIIILIIIQIYKRKSLGSVRRSKGNDEFKLIEQRLAEKQRFIYERIILLISCITLFSCLAAVRLQSRILTTEQHYTYFFLNLITMMFSLFYIFSTLTYQVLNVGKAHKWLAPFCSYSPYYIGYYVCYILIITPILVSGEKFAGLQAIFVMGGMGVLHLIIFTIWRPYKEALHNIANIFNNLVLLFVLGVTISMKFTEKNEGLSLIFAFVLLGLFFFIQCLAIVRIVLASRPIPKETQKLIRANNEEDEATKGFQMVEKQLLSSQQMKSRHPVSRAQLQADQLIRLKNRLKMEYYQKNGGEQTYQI